ncbi:hypothetical protein A2Y85_04155 [candidate division WOR-3 bacterium RBG_13_43_14]|uniref:Uncharacterized protein n=1 Tax=candidate division WOR-3 bacterium RBG_13_43_14 TaxID=1802590 RepID=A0A1F4UC92_UNCW3|nr:MAG: hypothetical protein A2Y85_04155 [candidate division WOR-3 bacterium RBG_13_43_14]
MRCEKESKDKEDYQSESQEKEEVAFLKKRRGALPPFSAFKSAMSYTFSELPAINIDSILGLIIIINGSGRF